MWKRWAYRDSMDRRKREASEGGKQVPEGWLEDLFVPLGYEAEGAWGPGAKWAFEQAVEAKGAVVCGELVDWNVVNFRVHWRRVIAVALAKGQASVVARAALPFEQVAGQILTEACQESNVDSCH